jgi:CRISPR-associated protein Cmr1
MRVTRARMIAGNGLVVHIVDSLRGLLSSARWHKEQGAGVRKSSGAPDVRGLADCIEAETQSNRTIEYRCTLVTPMYGGGVEAGVVDPDMPIRATAIRGQLRYWWRFLHRQRHPTLSAAEIFSAERRIWGGLGDASTLTKSRVTIFVKSTRHVRPRLTGARSYPAARYALYPALAQGNNAQLLAPGFKFDLIISGPDEVVTEVQESVKWWAAFGGIGARTRRGLGAVRVDDDQDRPLRIPSDAEVKAAGCQLKTEKFGDGNDPLKPWYQLISTFQSLRQGEGIARTPRPDPQPDDNQDPRPGRSFWPEPDTIRRIRGKHLPSHAPDDNKPHAFPRAMFGLPIITKFIDGGTHADRDPEITELRPIPDGEKSASKRMASPLVLKPMLRDDGWHAGVLRMPMNEVERMGLALYKGKECIEEIRAGKWWKPEFAPAVSPLDGHQNPIDAFISRLRSDASRTEITRNAVAQSNSSRPSLDPGKENETSETTLHRPRIKRNNANGSLTIEPGPGKKPVFLIGEHAKNCFDELSPSAQQHLRESRYPPFNKLTIVVDGNKFVRLEEHKE